MYIKKVINSVCIVIGIIIPLLSASINIHADPLIIMNKLLNF